MPVDAIRGASQDGVPMNESKKQFSFTRAASSTSGRARIQIYQYQFSILMILLSQQRNAGVRLSAFWFTLLYVVGSATLVTPVRAASARSSLAQSRTTNTAVFFYSDQKLEPAAKLRVAHIFKDYETKGFFRIGVLPLLVLDGFSIEVCDSDCTAKSLNQAATCWRSRRSSKVGIEARDFVLWFSTEKQMSVHARRARLENQSEWRLEDGTVNQPGALPLSFRTAILVISGKAAGELRCLTAQGTTRLQLLPSQPKRTRQN